MKSYTKTAVLCAMLLGSPECFGRTRKKTRKRRCSKSQSERPPQRPMTDIGAVSPGAAHHCRGSAASGEGQGKRSARGYRRFRVLRIRAHQGSREHRVRSHDGLARAGSVAQRAARRQISRLLLQLRPRGRQRAPGPGNVATRLRSRQSEGLKGRLDSMGTIGLSAGRHGGGRNSRKGELEPPGFAQLLLLRYKLPIRSKISASCPGAEKNGEWSVSIEKVWRHGEACCMARWSFGVMARSRAHSM